MRKIQFITGPAGTGKSHLLRQLLAEEERAHLIVAPTGIAAVAIGGSTIHRAFKIDINSGYARQKWPEIEVVYVDEVSMMGLQTFECIVTGAPNADLVLVGDMAQLPPVRDKYWFESDYIKQFEVKIKRLTKQWRQAKDPGLADRLNMIRNGTADKTTIRWIYSNSTLPEENEGATVIAYRNDTVRAINAENLLDLPGDIQTSEAEFNGHMKPGDCIAEADLSFKLGAEVVMIVNDFEGDLYQNGSRGKIVDWKTDSVAIKLHGSINTVWVPKYTWKMKSPQELTPMRREEIQYLLQNSSKLTSNTIEDFNQALKTGIEYVVIGTTKQYPFKLAYAMTVHKAQGMTLNNVHIITSGFAGCFGIGYVALSRAVDIDGISFSKSPFLQEFKIDPRIINYL